METNSDISNIVRIDFLKRKPLYSKEDLKKYFGNLVNKSAKKHFGLNPDQKPVSSCLDHCSGLLSSKMLTWESLLRPINSTYIPDLSKIIYHDFENQELARVIYQETADLTLLLTGMLHEYTRKICYTEKGYISLGKLGYSKASSCAKEESLKDTLGFLGERFEYFRLLLRQVRSQIDSDAKQNAISPTVN